MKPMNTKPKSKPKPKSKQKLYSLSVLVLFILFPLCISVTPVITTSSYSSSTAYTPTFVSLFDPSSTQIYSSASSEDFATVDTIYLTGNSLITDFSFDYLDDLLLINNQAFASKLQMQVGSHWVIDKDDIEVIYSYQSGNRTIAYLSIPAKNNITFYTNVDLIDGASKLEQKQTSYQLGRMKHLNLNGYERDRVETYLYYNYWDFGTIQTHNALYNDFSGAINMSFNIIDTGLPLSNTFDGTSYTKAFQYVGVSSAQVNSYYTFNLTTSAPNLYGQSPNSPESSDRNSYTYDQTPTGYSLHWDYDLSLDVLTTPTQSFDGGITAMSAGSSLSPKTADGEDTWSGTYTSMDNCSILYNLASLSPIVEEYSSQLTYTRYDTTIKDVWTAPLTYAPKMISNYVYGSNTITEPMALNVINRGLMTEIQINFGILTAYDVASVDDPTAIPLEQPQEVIEQQIWTAMISGMADTTLSGQGESYIAFVQSLLLLDYVGKVLSGDIPNPLSGEDEGLFPEGGFWDTAWDDWILPGLIIIGICAAVGIGLYLLYRAFKED